MSGAIAQDEEYLERRRLQEQRNRAQSRVDEIDSELNDLYRQVREKEAERVKWDRIASPDDYQ